MFALSGQSAGSLLTAVLITVLELTEVVAIVYALGAGSKTMRPGLAGAVGGVGFVGAIALGVGYGLTRASQVNETYTLLAGALILWFFAFFLLRSTFKTYLREDRKKRGVGGAGPVHHDEGLTPKALFATAFSVGAIETLEAVVVLIGLVAAHQVWEAVVGALVGGAILVTLGVLLHERIRKMKVPPLKWIATSLLFTFAIFWSMEAMGDLKIIWFPPTIHGVAIDILLVPLFVADLLAVRGAINVRLMLDRRARRSSG
ncbi:MAG: hypothetical protein KGJ23_15525 [Euryarchaeota archaeon]|nr:hypothetical protein [Euryarchaeota archaeon]MDE1838009.1 hypothetical protein [Euryarchaeota archaeon]MDE1881766.1 hypothetical protein [Euryarchaeota archaeon]MDE2046474.1 hypothetical protein [Thermoplasmata archaeon]